MAETHIRERTIWRLSKCVSHERWALLLLCLGDFPPFDFAGSFGDEDQWATSIVRRLDLGFVRRPLK